MPNKNSVPTPIQDRTCSRECPGLYLPFYDNFVRETPPPAPWAKPQPKPKDRDCISITCGIQ